MLVISKQKTFIIDHALEAGVEADPDETQLLAAALEFGEAGVAVAGFDHADGRREAVGTTIAIRRDRVVLGHRVGDAVRAQVAVAGDDDRLADPALVHDLQTRRQLLVVVGGLVHVGCRVDRTTECPERVPHVVMDVEHLEAEVGRRAHQGFSLRTTHMAKNWLAPP